jgi:hypothetical protein
MSADRLSATSPDRRDPAPRRPRSPRANEEALDQFLLAELDDSTLSRMDRDELTRVIEVSGHPWRADLAARLPYADRNTLLRLAFLGRHCTRQRLRGARGQCP